MVGRWRGAAPAPSSPTADTSSLSDLDLSTSGQVNLDYGKAAEAHRRGDEVMVRGDLTALGNAPRMGNIRSFTVRRVVE